jgi:hypothetical protein
VHVTVCPDWLQPGGSAAVAASASNPDAPTAINAAIAARGHRKLRDTLAETLLLDASASPGAKPPPTFSCDIA